MERTTLRIAAFGFRSLPPRAGSAGADKFAMELLPRLAARGHRVVAYNRVYPGTQPFPARFLDGVEIVSLRTVARSGFDTLVHSARATLDIILHNRADIVHIQNGGNSLFAVFLRLAGKKTFLSQDGVDWKRPKWPWYAKLYLTAMTAITARVHTEVIFDNVFTQAFFQKRYRRNYAFIPFGADVLYDPAAERILADLGLKSGEYFLYVGRFIPDKGLHYLTDAFSCVETDKKLVLVGGSPNPSAYEEQIRTTADERTLFPGYLYGASVHALMKHCYAHIHPSDVEGLSLVLLESAYLGASIICSDIPENSYGLGRFATYFRRGDSGDLREKLCAALADPDRTKHIGAAASIHVAKTFSWDRVALEHEKLFLAAGHR